MDNKRRIYALTGLPPEVVAVAFAKSSRSSEPFDVIARELNEDKSRKFHEKWVVGYGHSSVSEHAVLSIAIENVSILATKFIEDNRLASFTEKSSRYQIFDKDRYYKPENIMKSDLGKLYERTCDEILEFYSRLVPLMILFFKDRFPNETEINIKNKALDVCRYLLPVSCLTNLGMTINARNLEHAIVKLLTHPLKEMQEIGEEIKEAGLKVTPTLIKYTSYDKYLGETVKELEKKTSILLEKISDSNENGAVLVEFDKDAENKLIAAILYRFSQSPYKKIKEMVKSMNKKEKEEIIDEALKKMDKFDRPIRELEHVYYTFDVLMDYGGFRDVQRHRMCTQTNQEVTIEHGYETPKEIIEAGFEKEFKECMEKAKVTFFEIKKEFPKEIQYVIPLAFRKRVLITMNLRELFHFIKLRSGQTGHISYRRIAWHMYDCIKRSTLSWLDTSR